ncbi:MAG: pyridoxamine 5'-phosphate oxidase family protein, partial [Gammaproteobacteria bacterium]
MPADFTAPSPDRTSLHQHKERAAHDEAPAFLAEGVVAHVGIANEQGPVVIPMTYHFDPATPDRLYLHGAHASRLLNAAASGAPVCVTVTITDGLVYSKTALNQIGRAHV